MTWKRVRTLWPRWVVALGLVAAWAWPVNAPVPVPAGTQEYLTWGQVLIDGWVFFMAAAGACLGTGFSAAYYVGGRFGDWRRRVAEHSEKIKAADVLAVREWAAAEVLDRARDQRIEEGRVERVRLVATVDAVLIQLSQIREDLRAMRS